MLVAAIFVKLGNFIFLPLTRVSGSCRIINDKTKIE
jgi:hypothetical protein